MYSAPFEVVSYTEEPFSHNWKTLQPPQFDMLLFNVAPIPYKNIFAQIQKMEATETEQPSPPLRSPEVGELLSHFNKYKSLYSGNMSVN